MSQIVDCSEFCRLCLVKEQVNTPIFEEDGGYHQLSTKISTCLPVKVSREDSLPKRICDGCCYKVEQQYQFWNISLNAEKQFKQWLGISEDTETAKQNVNKIKKESTYDGPSASKRPKRNARRKAVQNIRQATAAQQSDSDSDIPLAARTVAPSIEVEPIAKDENDSDHHDFPEDNDSMDPPNFVNMNLEGEQDQAGPSGLQKAESTEPVEAAPATLNMEIEAGEGNNDAGMMGHIENQNQLKQQNPENSIKEEDMYMLKHNGYHCMACDKIFFQKDLCRRHYLRMHVENFEYTCDVCNKNFKYKWNLITHSKLHDVNRKKLTCEVCNKEYATPQSYKMHQNRHMKKYSFRCAQCNKGFYQKAELKMHIDADHNAIRYQCHICKKTFCSKGYLSIHYRVHDPNYVPPELKCEICGKTYHSQDLYRRHIKAHEGFPCDVCGKTLTSQISLKNHLLIHRGEKPLTCNVCGKCFNKQAILKVHMRTHTNERPYECKECGKRFAQRSPLVIHMRYHTGERPYPCKQCCEAFVSNTCLKAHIKKNHQYFNM